MSAADAAELHRAMFAAIERRDLDAWRALLAIDATHKSPDGEPVTGPEPVIAEVRSFVQAFPDLTLDHRVHLQRDPHGPARRDPADRQVRRRRRLQRP